MAGRAASGQKKNQYECNKGADMKNPHVYFPHFYLGIDISDLEQISWKFRYCLQYIRFYIKNVQNLIFMLKFVPETLTK